MRKPLAAALACVFRAAALAADERPQDRWRLEDIYANEAAWNADAAKVEKQVAQIEKCKGQLGRSAKRFKECLDLVYDATKTYYRMAVYSGERESEDTGDAARQSLNQKSQVIGTKLNEAGAFLNPEVLAIGKAKIDGFFKAEPGLAI